LEVEGWGTLDPKLGVTPGAHIPLLSIREKEKPEILINAKMTVPSLNLSGLLAKNYTTGSRHRRAG